MLTDFKNSDLMIKLYVKLIKRNKTLYKSYNFSNCKQKFSLELYLNYILYVFKTGISWRDLKGNRDGISWNSIYFNYRKLNSANIFKLSYIDLLNKYIKKDPKKKSIKIVSTDTTFVPNKKGKDCVGYNRFYNRKRGTKISIICDEYGVPLNVKLYAGNKNDASILIDQFNDKNCSLVSSHLLKKHTDYFLADPAYDTKLIRDHIENNNMTPIIKQNRRNIKDKSKIIKLTKKEEILYKKRLVIERLNNNIKMNKRLTVRYDVKIKSYTGWLFISMAKFLYGLFPKL